MPGPSGVVNNNRTLNISNIGTMGTVGSVCCALSVISIAAVVLGVVAGGACWGLATSPGMLITGKILVYGACCSLGASLLACCLCSCCCCGEFVRAL